VKTVFRSLGVRAVALCTFAAAVLSTPAGATVDPAHQFVTNGGFEQTTNGYGQVGYNTNLVGWTSVPEASGHNYSFVMNASNAQTGVNGHHGNLALWGPNSGSNNGLSASPTGGNFYAADGGYQVGAITQQINDLIIGQSYTLTFNWAGAQQTGYDGATTEKWFYGLYDQFQNQTNTINNADHGFTGWQTQTYNFVATQTSDTLYFMAQGTPSGQPPFSLLDSVSLIGPSGMVSAAPEPATWAMMMFGFVAVGFSLRRRRFTGGAALLAR
jgi:hypothetical protein